DETQRRRAIQMEHNAVHGIVPRTIQKTLSNGLLDLLGMDAKGAQSTMDQRLALEEEVAALKPQDLDTLIAEVEVEMREAAKMLAFEKAARLRDQWHMLKEAAAQN